MLSESLIVLNDEVMICVTVVRSPHLTQPLQDHLRLLVGVPNVRFKNAEALARNRSERWSW